MMFCSPLLFSSSPTWRAYALAPLRFSCNAETIIFSYHGLRNCFTIKDENTNGERSSAGRQWCFRNGVPWFEIRAKYIFHLRNEDCFLRKTAIATAMEVDHLAQTAIAFAEMRLSLRQSDIRNCRSKIVPCANRHRICRNEIVPPTKCHLQMPKQDCPLRKPSSHLPKWNCPSDTEASAIAIGLCTPWRPLHLICDGSIAGKTKGRKQMRRQSMRPVYDSISCPIHPQTGLQRQLRMWQHTNNESTNSISWER